MVSMDEISVFSPVSSEECVDGVEGFHRRLSDILRDFPSDRAFAIGAGLSPSGFARIVKGGQPTLPNLVKIAERAGCSVQWLATGELPEARNDSSTDQASAGVDFDLLTTVVEGLEEKLIEQNLTLPPETKAKIIPLLYQYFCSEEDDRARDCFSQNLVKMV